MSTNTVSTFFALLTLLVDAVVLYAAALALGALVSPRLAELRDRGREWFAPSALQFAWMVALVATLGSLYYSEAAHFVPCTLCWYQRIAMYPLAIVLGIAFFRRDSSIRTYVTPVAVIGAVIAAYHYQLEWFPSQHSLACTLDNPCNVRLVDKFGFISIPFMALSGFAVIFVMMRILAGHERAHPDEES